MHARNRTWPLGSDPAERCRQRTLPVEGGDGSTLSLDFTTGVLDPRLTFTRSTNATFINSSGYVEWAAANMFINSAWTDANNTPTGWTLGTATGSISRSGETRTFTCAAQQYWFYQQPATKSGLTYTLSLEVTAVSGTFNLADILLAGSSTSSPSPLGWYKNGVFLAGGGTTQATTGRFALVFTANSDNTICRIGLGAAGTNVTGSVTIRYAQIQPGIYVTRSYLENTSTAAANFNTPRFDYDPTAIGTPRGLLIEGSANNLLNWSETFDTTGGAVNWNWSINVTRGTVTTTNPTGASATVIKVEETTTNGLHTPLSTPTVLASTPYTFSVWAKAVERTFVQLLENGGSGANSMVNLSTGAIVSESTAGITTVTAFGTTGWYRISMRLTTIAGQTTANCQLRLSTNGSTTSYAGTTGSGIYIWGAQLETGSGASSYIPTGASTGSRAADNCATAISNVNGFNVNQGTAFITWRDNTASDTTVVQEWAFAFGLTLATGYGVFMPNSTTAYPIQGGVSNAGDASSANLVIGGINKAAIGTIVTVAPNTGTCRISANGAAVTTGTNISGYNAAQTLSFGQRNNNQRYLNGWIQQFKYWPYVLPDAQLQAITTLTT